MSRHGRRCGFAGSFGVPSGDGAQDAFERGLNELFDDDFANEVEDLHAYREYKPPHCEQCGARCMWFEVQGKFILHDPVTGDPHQCKFDVKIDLAGLTPYEFDENGQKLPESKK